MKLMELLLFAKSRQFLQAFAILGNIKSVTVIQSGNKLVYTIIRGVQSPHNEAQSQRSRPYATTLK